MFAICYGSKVFFESIFLCQAHDITRKIKYIVKVNFRSSCRVP